MSLALALLLLLLPVLVPAALVLVAAPLLFAAGAPPTSARSQLKCARPAPTSARLNLLFHLEPCGSRTARLLSIERRRRPASEQIPLPSMGERSAGRRISANRLAQEQLGPKEAERRAPVDVITDCFQLARTVHLQWRVVGEGAAPRPATKAQTVAGARVACEPRAGGRTFK